MYRVEALPSSIYLGRQTETGVNEIRIDCSAWFELWPDLTISMWVTRPKEISAYPVVTRMDGNQVVWDINDADTSIAGVGKFEIMGLAEGQRKLSAIAGTYIRESIVGVTADPPEAAQPWTDRVLDAAERAEAAAERAESASDDVAIQQIVAAVMDALPKWEGGEF